MDTLDKKILECLQKNARQSASDIGKTIHLSVSTVIDRIRKLEASGIIQHYTAVLDEKKLGNDVTALMEVSLEHPRYCEAFTNAVNDAKAIRDNQNATQSQVDLMTNNLTLAKETFVGSKYESIPDSSVIAFFDFETINDNTVASTGTKPVVGVLQAGPAEIFGSDTELPSLVDGVGAGKAIYFSKGNYLAVEDYNPADFLMNNMSWSAWVKVDDASRANNYIVSLNYWNNWKLNVENNGKPFFTVKTTTATVDMDNESVGTVKDGVWVHLAVTMDLNAHTVVFYVNGIATKTWDSATKENLTGSIASAYVSPIGRQLPLLIGAATVYDEAATWEWDSWKTPDGWDSMRGAIDNLGIYNTTLTAGQVARLYQMQKPQ
mgnify:CR=1 FL=1